MELKALIVDSDHQARQGLRHMLGDFSNINVVGEAASATEALSLVNALNYQVVFMEVNLPDLNGLELAGLIQGLRDKPGIIFVTANAEAAIAAFAVGAQGYLLKPLEPTGLKATVERIHRYCRERQLLAQMKTLKTAPKTAARPPHAQPLWKIDRLPAGNQGKTILVAENDIVYAFTLHDGVYLKTESEKLLTRFSLKSLEARLDQQSFFRTHRCYLVNLNKVKEIVPFFNGTYNLIVADKEKSEVPVSRAQAKKLKKILGL